MHREAVTVTIEYTVFELGERVTPSSSRSVLERDEVYTVTEFIHPCVPLALTGTVFVEGEVYGVSAENLRLADEE